MLPYKIQFKASVVKDLQRIGRPKSERILKAVREKLAQDPHQGIPLKGAKNVLWRYRVGDYRVLYSFSQAELWLLVVHMPTAVKSIAREGTGDKQNEFQYDGARCV